MSMVVTVANAGPDATDGVTVAVPAPAGLTYIGASSDRGGFASPPGLWQVGALPAGARATLTLTVRADAAGTFQIAAEVASSSVLDPTSTPANGAIENDRSGALLEVSPTPPPARTTVLRPLPRSLGMTVVRHPKRGRAKSLTVSGKLVLPRVSPAPRCGGRVEVTAKAGRKVVARRLVSLKKTKGVCRYTAVLRPKAPASARALKVSARFIGHHGDAPPLLRGPLGADPLSGPAPEPDYLREILTARVYDVARETELERAPRALGAHRLARCS